MRNNLFCLLLYILSRNMKLFFACIALTYQIIFCLLLNFIFIFITSFYVCFYSKCPYSKTGVFYTYVLLLYSLSIIYIFTLNFKYYD